MKKSLTYLIAIIIITMPVLSYSQEQKPEPSEHRYVGLGIRAGLQLSDLLASYVPPNRLILNIDAHKYFRIEGQYGLYHNTGEVNVQYYNPATGNLSTKTLNPEAKSSFLGGGVMGLFPSGNTRFIGGVRYSINNSSEDEINSWSSTVPTMSKSTDKMTIISGVIGGEYFFVKNFSVGAEFTFSSMKEIYTPPIFYGSTSTTSKTTMTEGAVIFRFYPF